MMREEAKNRCSWATKELEIAYHDNVWGVPKHDEEALFAFLILEGMQAGLSWYTILKKWDDFYVAFDSFDPNVIQHYDDEKIHHLMQNPGIIRNRLKINATIKNAQAFLAVQKEYGSFDAYIWHFTSQKTIHNKWKTKEEVPSSSPLSEKISKDMKKRGFNFVGPTIIYSYLQAIGVLDDHLSTCFKSM
ncbi:DNA-3-methyladenine glycosylase I [Vagococcus entomophilus]